MNLEVKRHPTVAKARKDMADVYHKIRRDHPPAARILYKREREALKELRKMVWGET